jgi:hypothetical protein
MVLVTPMVNGWTNRDSHSWAGKSDQEVRCTSVGTGVLLVPNGTITITRYGRRIGGLRRGCHSKFRWAG